MNRELGLKILSQIMGWDDEVARKEFGWLSFMSAYKYDGYRDYLAGARFVEKLATWLQQFEIGERSIAYQFVRQKLIYFSPSEIHRMVEKFFPEFVQPDLVKTVSETLGIPSYLIWSSRESLEMYRWERRKTLFMGLSDGARIDILRRANVSAVANDQVVISTQIDYHKWTSLLIDLREDLGKISGKTAENAKFSRVYLIDDFTASGTSLLRDPKNSGDFKGKLVRFANSLNKAIKDLRDDSPFVENFEVYVHHYIGTEQAKAKIEETYSAAHDALEKRGLTKVRFTFGVQLASDIRITEDSGDPFVPLCKKYYDPVIEGDGKHGAQSGTTNKMFGYAGCGLPVVIEHNTPNNSLPLIWADTPGENGAHRMTPLFRRRERHSDMEDSDHVREDENAV